MVVAVRDTSVTASATVTTPTARGCERGADGDDIPRKMFERAAEVGALHHLAGRGECLDRQDDEHGHEDANAARDAPATQEHGTEPPSCRAHLRATSSGRSCRQWSRETHTGTPEPELCEGGVKGSPTEWRT